MTQICSSKFIGLKSLIHYIDKQERSTIFHFQWNSYKTIPNDCAHDMVGWAFSVGAPPVCQHADLKLRTVFRISSSSFTCSLSLLKCSLCIQYKGFVWIKYSFQQYLICERARMYLHSINNEWRNFYFVFSLIRIRWNDFVCERHRLIQQEWILWIKLWMYLS